MVSFVQPEEGRRSASIRSAAQRTAGAVRLREPTLDPGRQSVVVTHRSGGHLGKVLRRIALSP